MVADNTTRTQGSGDVPLRQVRAAFTNNTVTVYQAYSPRIADPAVKAGRFVPPFQRDRMTWIKPSFTWMAYRSGWATKPDQERVLAIEITRAGFEWALGHSCLSHFDADVYDSHEQWKAMLEESPVRIQWDPERSITLDPLPYRAIQIGIGGSAVDPSTGGDLPVVTQYVDEWTVGITDVTETVLQIHDLVRMQDLGNARLLVPDELPYPVPADIAARIGAGEA